MARTQTLQVPQHLAGTDLRPVLTLLPVPADPTAGTGGAEVRAEGSGAAATLVKGALAAALIGHVASSGAALKDALGRPDHVWDTAGISRTATVTRIALVPGIGVAAYTRDVKPRLEVAAEALQLQGG